MLLAGQALAADLPSYDVPEVDYGLGGSFYLRGSAGLNLMWANEVNHPSGIPDTVFAVDGWGYGYSVGAGVGYETGTGLRFDVTADYLANEGLQTTIAGSANLANGVHKLSLRSTVVLANAYYDFGCGDGGYGAAGKHIAGEVARLGVPGRCGAGACRRGHVGRCSFAGGVLPGG